MGEELGDDACRGGQGAGGKAGGDVRWKKGREGNALRRRDGGGGRVRGVR